MKTIKVKLTNPNVECFDFESNIDIKGNKPVEVPYTAFIRKKIKEGTLEEVTTKGGGKDDNGTGSKGKKES